MQMLVVMMAIMIMVMMTLAATIIIMMMMMTTTMLSKIIARVSRTSRNTRDNTAQVSFLHGPCNSNTESGDDNSIHPYTTPAAANYPVRVLPGRATYPYQGQVLCCLRRCCTFRRPKTMLYVSRKAWRGPVMASR